MVHTSESTKLIKDLVDSELDAILSSNSHYSFQNPNATGYGFLDFDSTALNLDSLRAKVI
jgi:hypothetical protein